MKWNVWQAPVVFFQQWCLSLLSIVMIKLHASVLSLTKIHEKFISTVFNVPPCMIFASCTICFKHGSSAPLLIPFDCRWLVSIMFLKKKMIQGNKRLQRLKWLDLSFSDKSRRNWTHPLAHSRESEPFFFFFFWFQGKKSTFIGLYSWLRRRIWFLKTCIAWLQQKALLPIKTLLIVCLHEEL